MAKVETKTVKGFPDYTVTTSGLIFSHKRGAEKQINGSVWQGYRKVNLNNNGKSKTIAVHRLVAETFLTKPRGCKVVNHIDGDKSNNNLSNLEWTTHKGNSKHYVEKLSAGYKVKRAIDKQDKLKNNLAVVNFAYTTFKDDPESFCKVYGAIFAI